MNYKSFNIKVIFYVAVIILTIVAFMWALDQQLRWVTKISLGVLLIVEVGLLLRFVKKINREVAHFLESIKFQDDGLIFKKLSDKSFAPLYEQFNRIIGEMKKVKTEKKIEHQYFVNTIKHVPVGLISYRQDGKVDIFNEAASQLLNLNSAKWIEDLEKVSSDLKTLILDMQSGHQEVIKVNIRNEIVALYVKVSEFKLEENYVKLVSLQNITTELEEGEIEAWQKLISILTHEIINSVSPISLLSSSLIGILEKDGRQVLSQDLDEKDITTSIESLKAILKRSNGLKRFLESYKSITRLPKPQFSLIEIRRILEQVHVLMKGDLEPHKIDFEFNMKLESIQIEADEKLIEQVLINIVQNAIYAVKDVPNPTIRVSVSKEESQVVVEIVDNGVGISESEINNIFLPFYTTREDGSGIGLSLSKQIMRLHKGMLKAESKDGRTRFRMIF